MNRGIRFLVLLLAVILSATGCSMIKINKEVDEQTVLAEFTGGKVLKSEAQAEYDAVLAYYADYGVALDDEESIAAIKAEILDYLATDAIVTIKAKELGLNELTQEETQTLTESARQEYEDLIENYRVYFETGAEDETAESVRAEIEAYLAEQDYSVDQAIEYTLQEALSNKMYDYITKDVAVSDEQVQTAYQEMVAADQESFEEDPYNFEYAALSGGEIFWYPEGYRTVKHILLGFTEEQAEALGQASMELEDVRYQIEDLDWAEQNPEEAAAWEDEEGHVHTEDDGHVHAEDEEIDLSLIDEEEAPQMSREELEAEEKRLSSELDALRTEYAATLQAKVDEVLGKMAAGEDFDDLIAEYGEDAGMDEEPGKSVGYYVSANSEMWEPTFTAAAMALEKPGDVSEPVTGDSGVHIIKYMAEVKSGAAPLEQVSESAQTSALEMAKEAAYEETVAAWVAEAGLKTYPEKWK